MFKVLLRFWPVLIPLLLYGIWRLRRKRTEEENPLSDSEAQLWAWTLVVSLVIAILSIGVVMFTTESNRDSEYQPALYKDGKLVPGEMVPRDRKNNAAN